MYVEGASKSHRANAESRIHRFTRLTNAFSKKRENHYAALALYSAYYNLERIHSTLRVTPAIEAGLADHVWTYGELLA